MILTTISIVLAGAFVAPLPGWVPQELADASRYQVVYVHPNGSSIKLVRRSDGAAILMDARESTTEQASHEYVPQAVVVPGKTHPASGYPVGRQNYVVFEPGHAIFDAVNPNEEIWLDITAPWPSHKWGSRPRPDDFSKRAAWVESIVRQAMSNYAQRRIGAMHKVAVNGKQVSCFVATLSKAEYVDLKAWAAAKGLSVHWASKKQRASIALRAGATVFSLGSGQAKAGGAWKSMPDIFLEYKGRLWVPLAFLR